MTRRDVHRQTAAAFPDPGVERQLAGLRYCITAGLWEDAAGHLCDLLECARRNIQPDDGALLADLHEMVGHYGRQHLPLSGR